MLATPLKDASLKTSEMQVLASSLSLLHWGQHAEKRPVYVSLMIKPIIAWIVWSSLCHYEGGCYDLRMIVTPITPSCSIAIGISQNLWCDIYYSVHGQWISRWSYRSMRKGEWNCTVWGWKMIYLRAPYIRDPPGEILRIVSVEDFPDGLTQR